MKVALHDWRVELLREHNYPFVMIGRTENNQGLTFIDLDFENAILEAYAHLVGLGHQHIGFLTFPKEWRIEGMDRSAFDPRIQEHSQTIQNPSALSGIRPYRKRVFAAKVCLNIHSHSHCDHAQHPAVTQSWRCKKWAKGSKGLLYL
jgi:DNA-binding LacI/PurR family transcriptional regulator